MPLGIWAVVLGMWSAATTPIWLSLAQTAPGDAVSPYLEGGAVVIALGSLAYIVRQLTNGSLVHRDIAQTATLLSEANDRLETLLAESYKREDRYIALLESRIRKADND